MFESHGGLYQVVFLFRFFFFLVVCPGLNVNLKSQPLSSSAFWLGGIASLKLSLLEEMLESRLLMFSGMFFFNARG